MSVEVEIGNGCAKVPAGDWLVGSAQPVASEARFQIKGLKGFVVPDRASVRAFSAQGEGSVWFASAESPFLTRLDALPDEALSLVSAKLLLAPMGARVGARMVRPIPMSFRASFAVTELRGGWAVAATASRVTRVVVEEGKSLMVRPEAVVAWNGQAPTGFCPRLGLLDLILPRGPKNFALDFHGPSVVWFEGGAMPLMNLRQVRRMMGRRIW